MDIYAAETSTEPTEEVTLSYDDSVPYAEQGPVPSTETADSSLASRIGHTKVYLLSDATTTRTGKRKYEEEEEFEDEMEEDVSDPSLRDNAILFQGSPISHLPTSNIFAYATHFDTHPIAMEWIDDLTCILVFSTKSAARVAFRYLAKSHAEEPSDEGFITSKPIPVAIWPAKERIDKSLGVGEGLKGPIRMRWALTSDVKKRGAKNQSQFYRKYGTNAGKEGTGNEDHHLQKRRRGDEGEISDAMRKAQLDEEMDAFIAADDAEPAAPSPPSKMRADYVNGHGKSLLERTSDLRQHPVGLETRFTERWSKHSDHHHGDGRLSERIGGRSAGERRSREGGSRKERPRPTQEELDAELDAFLAKDDTEAT